MTTTRVERYTASVTLWVTNTTAKPRARHSAISSSSSRCRVKSSSAAKGSSISPPESSRGRCHAKPSSATSASASATARSDSARGVPARSSGSRTFDAMSAHGISVGDWNT